MSTLPGPLSCGQSPATSSPPPLAVSFPACEMEAIAPSPPDPISQARPGGCTFCLFQPCRDRYFQRHPSSVSKPLPPPLCTFSEPPSLNFIYPHSRIHLPTCPWGSVNTNSHFPQFPKCPCVIRSRAQIPIESPTGCVTLAEPLPSLSCSTSQGAKSRTPSAIDCNPLGNGGKSTRNTRSPARVRTVRNGGGIAV